MNQHDDARTEDPARDSVRAALPTPDDATTERIAARIATGDQRRRMAGTTTRRRWSIPMLRPALAIGAVAAAAGIALLAPGGDPADTDGGFIDSLGPSPAAADVLHAAGRTVADAPWRPLGRDEVHAVTTRDSRSDDPIVYETETQVSGDGRFALHARLDSSRVADGDSFYMPAERCDQFDVAAPPTPNLEVENMLTVGSRPPACWKDGGVTSPLLHGATGTVVDAPPTGAVVYLDRLPAASDGRPLRFGTEVRESDEGSSAPGGMSVGVVGPDGIVTEPEFHEHVLPIGVTWIEVEPGVVSSYDIEGATGQPSTLSPMFPGWTTSFNAAQIADFPTDADAVRARLEDAAAAFLELQSQSGPAIPTTASETQIAREDHMVLLAADLLASAPLSPDARRATFDALAALRSGGEPAEVVTDATLPDGRAAIGVKFPWRHPGAAAAETDGEEYTLMLLDAETARLVRRETHFRDTTFTTTWSEPTRDPSSR